MFIFFTKSQQALFDTPVHVAAHVRKDGSLVPAHTRIQKVAVKKVPHHQASLFGEPEPAAKVKRTKLDAFIERKGGLRALGAVIASMSQDQQEKIFAELGKMDGKTAEDVAAMFADHYDKPAEKGETPDLFAGAAEPVADEGSGYAEPVAANPSEHRYAMVNRPVSIGTAPKDFTRLEDRPAPGADHHDHARNGVAVYNRKLTDAETKQFEMAHMADGDDRAAYASTVADDMREYADAYVEMAGEDPEQFARTVADRLKRTAKGHPPSVGDMKSFAEMVRGKLSEKPEPAEPAPPELVEHVTKNGAGKTIRGVVRTDLTQDEAKAIDPYTFKKNGGWFIREKHLTGSAAAPRTSDPETTDRAAIVDTGDKLSDYWANSAGESIRRDIKAGRVKKVDLTKKPVAQNDADEADARHARMADERLQRLAARRHDPTAPFGVAAGITKKKRLEINSAVVSRLADGGPYTDEDRALFRQYSGNGGCGDSLNEYYTDPDVARSMWTAIASLGVTSGEALEPSCATGVFLHTAPEGFKVTGVELDPTSAGAALALHGDRHEINTASFERFATMDSRQFDVVIGNPPYGPRGSFIKDDKKDLSTAEDYFFDTSIDKCKPGGIVALVVPTGIMDSASRTSLRNSWLKRAEFLGAMRMPNTAFEHSHTGVTTDVVFMRKRPDDIGQALSTIDKTNTEALQKLGVWDEEFQAGTYFTGRGAENVLGTMEGGWREKAGMGHDITVNGSMDGVAPAIAAFEPHGESVGASELTMEKVLDALPEGERRDRAENAAARPRAYSVTAKVGDTKVVDGVTYILQGNPPRWHTVEEYMQTPAISDAQSLAADIDTLMNGSGAVDRPALEAAVRAYVEKHGIPADNVDLMTAASADRRLFRLVGAVNRKGELSDVVTGKSARKVEGGFDATAQVLALEHDGDTFPASELAERLGKPVDEVEDQLAADARYAYALGGWTTMDAYLTGDLWLRLDAAKKELELNKAPELADKLKMQIDRLDKKIDAKSLDDVEIQINSGFIPTHVVAAFLNWKQYDSPSANKWTKEQKPVEITFADGVFTITGGNTYGDIRLLDKYLNRTGVKKDERDDVARLNEEFKEWLCGSTYRDAVEEKYNRTFRGFVAPEYSNEPIDVPGLNPEKTVRDWRWSSLRRSLVVGKGIIADDVGLGKTLGGLLLARMAKVQGSAKKPIIVVPKSVLANWYDESQTWFPGCKVLTIGANFSQGKAGELVGKDDSAAERKRKYHDLTQNDYDFILISEPAFEEVDLDPIKKEEYYGSDFWVQRGEALGNAGDKRRKAIRENYEQAIAKREFSDRTDAIYFNELGVDMLIADEMHHQKNLYAAKARFGDQPKFLGGQGLSNRALDFNLKTRWIREQNDGKNVHGLTATPTKNSPLEIYSMLSHIAPEAFERIQIRNSEEFLDRFCEFTGDKVLSTAGEIEDATVVSGFKNLDELREIMDRYIDRRTAEQVGLKLPSRDDRMHMVDMTSAQQDVYTELRELAEESAGKKDATGDAHIFAIMDKMNKAALDLSLLDDKHAGAESPKYKELAKQCKEGAKEGGQIVFSEYIASHDKIVQALVDAGFKREEIGVINAQVAASSVKRQNIAQALNNGKLKVVVGNCVMAEGLNMQKTTTDIHHMDVPWEPATLQQRNGRGLRQGNLNESLRIHTYLSKGSFDGYRYQAVAAKKDWQDLLWNGGDRVDNLAREGAFTLDDMRIMLAADPEAARAKFDEDKTEATKRYETGERAKAQSTFVKFTEMSRSYSALKNKGTESAERLRQKIESTKTGLFNNKFWPAKAQLDSATDVLIHPQTGTVLTADQGLDFGKDGKMVVTGVNMKAGTVTMRHHASMKGGQVTMPMSELSDAKPFKFDATAEANEVGALMESAANEKLNSLDKWADVKAMPAAVLEKNYDLIQRQMKDAKKSYKGFHDLGDAYMVDKATGKIEKVASYGTTAKHETHDYLLPTSDAKEKAIQAWIDERRGANLGVEYVQRRSGRGSRSGGSDRLARRSYKGADYNSKNINPMRGLLTELSGGTTSYGSKSALEREAADRLKAEQIQSIRRAGSAIEAIESLMPLAKVTGTRASNDTMGGYANEGSNVASFPKNALALAWARARHLGELDRPVSGPHSDYAYGGAKNNSVHSTLIRMAHMSGHEDLAAAFAHTSERHGLSKDYAGTLRALTGYNRSQRTLEAVKKIALRMGISDKTLGELRDMQLGGIFAARQPRYGSAWDTDSHNAQKFSDVLNENLEIRTRKEAA
jgi:SNF2 family DNA or RNA helicase/predicted RNA methylase